MLGDFNEVLCGEDKYRGRQVNINRALECKDCLNSCNMIDLGFAGPRFTWTNKRLISDLISERIYRCFANLEWRIMYPEATVTYLSQTFSNHCPMLVDLFRPPPNASNWPFRFQQCGCFIMNSRRLFKVLGQRVLAF